MIVYVLFGLLALLFVTGIICSWAEGHPGPLVVCVILGAVIQLPTISFYAHAVDDVGFMSQINNRIAMVEVELNKLDQQIKDAESAYSRTSNDSMEMGSIKVQANADSPVATLLVTRMTVVEKLISYKDSKFKMLAKITANCLGPMSKARTMFIDGYCSQD